MVRHGKVVLDDYFYPFGRSQLHDFASVTKSVTSAVIGQAIDEGKIKSVHEPVLGLLRNSAVSLSDPRKRLILSNTY